MRLNKIFNINQANYFLKEYLPKHNLMFSIPPKNPKNLHRSKPNDIDIDWIFAFREKRMVTNDFTIYYRNRVFLLKKQSIALKKRRVTVLENLNEEIRIWFNGRFLEFEEITEDTLNYLRDRKQNMKETIKKTSSKTWKPASNHPWRLQNRALFKELRR